MDICLIRAKNVTTKSVRELFEMNKRWLSLVRDIKIKKIDQWKNRNVDVGDIPMLETKRW